MKNLFLIVFLAISVSVSSQIQFQPKGAFEYAPNGYKFVAGDWNPYQFGNFRTKIGLEIIYGKFSLAFDNHIYSQSKDIDLKNLKNFQFNPTRVDYFVELNYNISDKIKVSVGHLCIHPVVTRGIQTQLFNGGYRSISISYGY